MRACRTAASRSEKAASPCRPLEQVEERKLADAHERFLRRLEVQLPEREIADGARVVEVAQLRQARLVLQVDVFVRRSDCFHLAQPRADGGGYREHPVERVLQV